MSAYRRTLLSLAVLSIALPLSASATSPEACLADLTNTPPAKVAQSYAARLKTEKLPREAAFWSNYCVGRAWFFAGELKKAEPALRAATKLAQSPRERHGAQSVLGVGLQQMNRLDAAETTHQAALDAAREMGGLSEQATELSNLGLIALKRKLYDQALTFFTRSLTLQTGENEKAAVLNNMANVHHEKADYALAAQVYQQAIAIDRRLGQQQQLAAHLLNLGNTYRKLQDWENCGKALEEGLALARANGDRYWEATGLKYYAWGFSGDQNWARAREFYTAALKIYREIGAAGDAADVERSLAKLGG